MYAFQHWAESVNFFSIYLINKEDFPSFLRDEEKVANDDYHLDLNLRSSL